MSSDLTAFLLARIAEDEEVAKAATQYDDASLGGAGEEQGGPVPHPSWQTSLDLAHIARHDPARVLAECATKRRIVEIFPDAAPDGDGWNEAGVQVLELLALPYADHPDYRDE